MEGKCKNKNSGAFIGHWKSFARDALHFPFDVTCSKSRHFFCKAAPIEAVIS